MPENNLELLDLTAGIVSAYVAKNSVPAADLGAFIASTHAALLRLGNQPEAPAAAPLVPAVPIRKSVTPEALICLEDGKPFKSLKRHLSAKYDMTPDQYRAKWGLPSDYPMTAPAYAERRSALARAIGLGRKAEPIAEPEPVKPQRGRPRKALA
jgi:predicted transcriptional regulator